MSEDPKHHRGWTRSMRSILLLLFAVAMLLTAAIWFTPAVSQTANQLNPKETTLIGQWTLDGQDGPGTMRFLQFRSDHTVTSMDVSAASNEIIQSVDAHWSFSGTTLLIDERTRLQHFLGRSGEQ